MRQDELNKKQKHSPRTINGNGNYNSAHTLPRKSTTLAQHAPSTSHHRSPTIPRLKQYTPFGNSNGLPPRTQQVSCLCHSRTLRYIQCNMHRVLIRIKDTDIFFDERDLRGTRGLRRNQNQNQNTNSNYGQNPKMSYIFY